MRKTDRLMKVAVGSTNPTKIAAVREVFIVHFPQVEVVGVKVSSGVSEQPMDDEETYKGALNRSSAALQKVPDAEFGVGIEGGLHKHGFGWFEHSLVVIQSREGLIGVGASGGIVLPNAVISRIHEGKNLEEVVDELFGTTKIGEGIGMFGIFTKEVVTRKEGMKHGVAFAFGRFLHKKLYE